MSTIDSTRPSTRRTVKTLHTAAVARERARKEAARTVTVPPWFTEVSAFLRQLGLDGQQLAAVTRHLDATRSAEGVPVLRPNDAAVLAGIISRDGQQAPQPPRLTIASAGPVETPDASTEFTPEPFGAYHPADDDVRWVFWAGEVGAAAARGPEPVHPCRSRVVEGYYDYDHFLAGAI